VTDGTSLSNLRDPPVRRTPDEIANVVRLTRTVRSDVSFLVVEGPTDALLFRNLIETSLCEILVGFDRSVALAAIRILEIANVQGVLAVVDADFDHLDGVPPQSRNVVVTDGHDIEMLMIASPTLDKVLGEFGSSDKIRSISHNGEDVIALLLRSARPLGYLRWLSRKRDFGFDFERIRFGEFLHRERLSVDATALIVEVRNHSRRPVPTVDQLKEELEGIIDESHDPWQVCCGHDVVEILAIGFRRVLGSQRNIDSTGEKIEQALRLAYESSFFVETKLFSAIVMWERENSPYQILRR